MRKLIWLMHVSLDGFVAGPNGEINWIYIEDAIFDDVQHVVDGADTALYGRVTYEMMERYWPTAAKRPGATKHDIEHGNWVNSAQKIVFSRTLKKTSWQNTKIISDNIAGEINDLKKKPGKNLLLLASPGIAKTLLNLDLIDEYWFNVSPIVLGKGKPLFSSVSDVHRLRLLESRSFNNGVVRLHYGRG